MIEPASIAEILGLGQTIRTVRDLEFAVSAGLPKSALERLSTRLYRDRRTASAYKFKVVPQATWKRRSRRLSVEESERTERLARVLAAAEYVWDDRDLAREWMSKPHRELGDRTPLETARTELGARRVEAVLEKLYFGLPA
jgi:putative toxin-antitoxin system antitoxin component (TIGR02293 family)